MSTLPQIHEGRDTQRQVIRAVNLLLRQVPAPAVVTYPVIVNLRATGPTVIVPAGVSGFVVSYVDIVLRDITGVVVVPAQVEFGSNATFDNIAAATVIPGATLVDEIVPVTLAATMLSLTGPIYANVTVAATGVTEYTAECYAVGYWRVP